MRQTREIHSFLLCSAFVAQKFNSTAIFNAYPRIKTQINWQPLKLVWYSEKMKHLSLSFVVMLTSAQILNIKYWSVSFFSVCLYKLWLVLQSTASVSVQESLWFCVCLLQIECSVLQMSLAICLSAYIEFTIVTVTTLSSTQADRCHRHDGTVSDMFSKQWPMFMNE